MITFARVVVPMMLTLSVGCGLETGEPLPDTAGTPERQWVSGRSALCAPTTEAPTEVPRTVALETWDWSRPFFPVDRVSSEYVVLMPSPVTKGRFRAYGIDVVGKTIIFVVEGNIGEHARQFRSQLVGEFSNFEVTTSVPIIDTLVDRGTGSIGQIIGPPPPPPTPGGDDGFANLAWQGAQNLYYTQANLNTGGKAYGP